MATRQHLKKKAIRTKVPARRIRDFFRSMKKLIIIAVALTTAGCAADRVNKEAYTVSKKKTYPSLVMAPPACKLPENRYAGMCTSYNYLEVITAPPKL